MKSKAKPVPPDAEHRQAEADKTSRLRALRLAKEASDLETATQAAVKQPRKPSRAKTAR